MKHLLFVTICLSLASGQVKATNWDVFYSGSVLPENATPSWTMIGGSMLTPTVSNGFLRIVDNSPVTYSYYQRESWVIDAGQAVTMEARMRINSAADPLGRNWATTLSIQTKGASVNLAIHPEYLRVYNYGFGEMRYYANFNELRTIRLALDTANNVYAWVDGALALSYAVPASGGQSGIFFGAASPEGMSDTDWQYVAYSKAFLPVPEPATLVTLACGLAGMAGILRRKTKHRLID